MNVGTHIGKYLGDRSPVERASSFDYCFNYFQSFKDHAATNEIATPENLERSCLHLGYYLASWGMLRGSTALHTKSYPFFEPVVEAIAAEPFGSWSIDADSYGDANIAAILETRIVWPPHSLRSRSPEFNRGPRQIRS